MARQGEPPQKTVTPQVGWGNGGIGCFIPVDGAKWYGSVLALLPNGVFWYQAEPGDLAGLARAIAFDSAPSLEAAAASSVALYWRQSNRDFFGGVFFFFKRGFWGAASLDCRDGVVR